MKTDSKKHITDTSKVLDAGYSTLKALEIGKNYRKIDGFYNKCLYINSQHGIKLVVKNKRFWFEYYGKQITITDYYVGCGIKRILSLTCG